MSELKYPAEHVALIAATLLAGMGGDRFNPHALNPRSSGSMGSSQSYGASAVSSALYLLGLAERSKDNQKAPLS